MSDAELARAVGLALTGQADGLDRITPDVLTALADAGWDAERILAHAEAVLAGGGVWPHPVPDALRARVGSARLFAVLQRVQQDLGLFGRAAAPAPRRPLTADERRLLHDVPPHHGT